MKRLPIGVYWGRFNPPHKGHLGIIRRFKDGYRLIVAIGSAEHRDERRNPFSGRERKSMMESYLKEAGIDGVRVVTLEDGPSETWSVDKLVRRCQPEAILLSTEQRGGLDVALKKAGVRVLRFRRTGNISSTRIRRLIASGDPRWRALTGRSVARLIEEFDGIERVQRIYAGVLPPKTLRPPPPSHGHDRAETDERRGQPRMPLKIVEVTVPEYTVRREPDYLSVGAKVDRAIETNFPNGSYVLRALGLDDHPGLTLQDLVEIVRATGTDKYDPNRRAVGHGEFSGYDYDIQAGPLEIRRSRLVLGQGEPFPTVFGGIAWHFYHDAPLDRGHPVRIDLLLLYDPKKVVRARKIHPHAKGVRKGLDRFLYKFTNPTSKGESLLGLVKVLR